MRDGGGEILEHGGLLLVIDEVRTRHERPIHIRVRQTIPHQHQLLGILERQRPEEDGIGDAEDGHDAADPQRQRQHEHRRVSRALGERAEGVLKILAQETHEGNFSAW